MQKIYLLLRNNKQIGPLSLEELIQHELKSSDLIWIEGRSAGWSNPQDINELKSYLPVAAAGSNQDKIETTTVQKSVEEKKPSAPAKKRSVLSKRIFISLPAGVKNSVTDEEASQDKLEKKAQELYNKIQAFSNNKETAKEINEPEIKYSRSLTDIKNEYAEWLTQQRNKKRNLHKKTIAIAATALVIITAAFLIFSFYKKENSSQQLVLQQATSTQNEIPNSEADISVNNKVSSTPADAVVYNATNQENFVEKDLPLVINEPVASPAIMKEKVVEDDYHSNASQTVKEEQVIQPTTNKSDDKVIPQVQNKDEKKIPLTKLISIRHKNLPGDKKGLEPQVITVENNSDKLLKVVAVDVTYYDRNNNKVHMETIYFSNVEPNKSLTLTAPGHKKAFTAETQFGLISSEEGSLFFAKQ